MALSASNLVSSARDNDSSGGARMTATDSGGLPAGSARRPIFLLCTARSGSTLLRFLLNAHPDIACPPEPNLCTLLSGIRFTARAALGRESAGVDDRIRELGVYVAERTLGSYAAQAGKSRWCDKSIPTLDHAEFLLEIFPDAQFICLYRECADTVASIQGATVWGNTAIYERYATRHPSNRVTAFCSYWADRVRLERDFEDRHPDLCQRIRYEDLVTRPVETLRDLFNFLEVEASDSEIDASLTLAGVRSEGPGDGKIRYTDRPHNRSVGRGWSVPIEIVPQELKQRVNALASELGYRPLLESVGESVPPVVDHLQSPATNPRSLDVARLFESRVQRRLAAGTLSELDAVRNEDLRIFVVDEVKPWLVDYRSSSVTRRNVASQWTLLTDAETLLTIADGQCNPAEALASGKLRLLSTRSEPLHSSVQRIDAFASLIVAGDDEE